MLGFKVSKQTHGVICQCGMGVKKLKTTEIIKSIPMKRKACLKWESHTNEDGNRRSKCVKRGYKKLPRSQRLDTYLDFASFSERQNSGSAMFTIPRCREEFH